MGKTVKNYSKYVDIPMSNLANGTMITSNGEAQDIANNVLANYAQARRVHHSSIWNWPIDGTNAWMHTHLTDGKRTNIVGINASRILTGASGILRAWVYYKTGDAGNTINLYLRCGRHEVASESVENASWGWKGILLNIDLSASTDMDSRMIYLIAESIDDDNSIDIKSISIYEYGYHPYYWSYVTTTGATNKLGTDDYPYSAAMGMILAKNTDVIHRRVVPRKNILNQWFGLTSLHAVAEAYSADADGLGRWMIMTGDGTTAIKAKVYWTSVDDDDLVDLKMSIYTTAGVLVGSQEVEYDGDGTPTSMYSSFDSLPAVSANTEYEIRFDCKGGAAGDTPFVFWQNVFIYENLGTDVDFVLPNKRRFDAKDDIESQDWKNIKNTNEKVYARQRQVLLNNYSFRDDVASAIPSAPGVTQLQLNCGEYVALHTMGVLMPSYGTRRINFEIMLSRIDSVGRYKMSYAGVGGFDSDDLVLFESGAWGVCVYDDTASNVLYLKYFQGIAKDGDDITTTPAGETATLSGMPEIIGEDDIFLYIELGSSYNLGFDSADALVYKKINLKGYPRGKDVVIKEFLDISREFWNSVADIGSSGTPLLFRAYTSPARYSTSYPVPIDFVIFHSIKVYEEIPQSLEDY